MARSNPSLVNAEIPTEAQPNNRFTIDVKVEQGGPDPWASENSCNASYLNILGWETPIKLFVDGQEVDEKTLCIGSGGTKTGTLSTSLSKGTHTVKVAVYQTGGNAYDLEGTPPEENDTMLETVNVTEEADDPSKPSAGDKFMAYIEDLAKTLGGTTTQVMFGMALAVVLLMVI